MGYENHNNGPSLPAWGGDHEGARGKPSPAGRLGLSGCGGVALPLGLAWRQATKGEPLDLPCCLKFNC